MEADIDRDASEAVEALEEQNEPKAAEESEEQNEPEELEELNPIDAALEQYRIIIGQADSYDYGQSEYEANQPERESVYYWYALVQMQPDDPIPTLLLERSVIGTEISAYSSYDLFFQYNPETKTVHHPTEVIAGGGVHGGLGVDEIGGRVLHPEWSETGEGSVARITLDGDSLNRDILWTGHVSQVGNVPEINQNITDIFWHEIGDLSALDSWTAPSEPTDSATLPTDGDRIVLTGTVGTYDHDEIVALQGQPDPNVPYFDESALNMTYRVIVLDTPQTLRIRPGSWSGEEDYYSSHEALMIDLCYVDVMEQYEGQHITFSIDPAATFWPSDTSLPLGQPHTSDIHILD